MWMDLLGFNVFSPSLALRVSGVALALFCWSVARGAGPALVTVEGAPRGVELRSVADGLARFVDDAAKAVETPVEQIVSWGAPREAVGAQVLFADGSVLVAELTAIDGERLTVVSPTLGAVTIPLTQVAAYVAHPPTDSWRRDAFLAKLIAAQGESDRLLLENGDELGGTLLSSDGTSIRLDATIGAAKGNEIETPLENVAAIVFNPALRAKPRVTPPRTWIGFDDGSLLLANDLALSDEQWTLTRPEGAKWETRGIRQSPVQFLQPLDGQATYLSDLEPEAYRHIPYLTREWPYLLDRTVSGARLRAGNRLYAKGIGMHSASRLTFPVGGTYRRFDAELAVDDETAGGGSVVFRVFADATEKYRSPVIRGGDPPAPISVDISGAQRLSLVVDHAERGDQQDRADWLNARLVK
jgi:hypothetical protein